MDKEVEKMFKDKKTDKKYKKKVKQGGNNEVFNNCLGKVCNKFIKKYDIRK